MQLQSYTFTLEEMRAEVFKLVHDMSLDELKHAKNQEEYAEAVENASNLMKMLTSKDEVVTFWCEMLSEWYFDTHPHISDVLLFLPREKFSPIMKEWVASAE